MGLEVGLELGIGLVVGARAWGVGLELEARSWSPALAEPALVVPDLGVCLGPQLEGSVFGVLVLQLKPQLERVLNLPASSLTKEIELTQQLLGLFVTYQIPACHRARTPA